MGALGDSVTIELDVPIGGGEPSRLLHRRSRGHDMVSVDDAGRVRAQQIPADQSTAVDQEVRALARAGETNDAIPRYRELNGATLEAARAYVAKL